MMVYVYYGSPKFYPLDVQSKYLKHKSSKDSSEKTTVLTRTISSAHTYKSTIPILTVDQCYTKPQVHVNESLKHTSSEDSSEKTTTLTRTISSPQIYNQEYQKFWLKTFPIKLQVNANDSFRHTSSKDMSEKFITIA
jgi:hypothetical protein